MGYFTVCCQIVICFVSFAVCYVVITRFMFFIIRFKFVFIFFCVLFSILCGLCFCIVLCVVSPHVYSCFFPICAAVNAPLLPSGKPTAVNKCHISYDIFYILNILYIKPLNKDVENPDSLPYPYPYSLYISPINKITY